VDVNWEAVGAVAEMLGAVATVATLGYLALQVRQNTRVAKTSATNARVDQRSRQSAFIAQTPESNRLFWAGLDEPESLSSAEYQYFEGIFATYFNGHEAAFNLKQENVPSPGE
jgi:hypothetical protein